MSQQECVRGCGVPTSGAMLCRPCAGRIEYQLGQVPALEEELDTLLSRQSVMTERSDGGRSAEKPLPYHTEASRVSHVLRAQIVGWVRDLADDDPGQYPRDTLSAMSTWLLARMDIIANHAAADDIHDEIVDTCQEAWRVVDLAANRTRFYVGPCPGEHVGDECPGEVWAYIPTDAQRDAARLECRSCGTRWETHQWLRAGKRILAMRDSWTQRQRRSPAA